MNITRFNNYMKGCLITWNSISDQEGQILNATLGLVGEVMEFSVACQENHSREDKVSEAGDVLYYTSILMIKANQFYYPYPKKDDEITTDLAEDVFTSMNQQYIMTDLEMKKTLGLVVETVKKVMFHGKKMSVTHFIDDLLPMYTWLNTKLIENSITIEEVVEYNFTKLAKRYPDGFKRLAEAQA